MKAWWDYWVSNHPFFVLFPVFEPVCEEHIFSLEFRNLLNNFLVYSGVACVFCSIDYYNFMYLSNCVFDGRYGGSTNQKSSNTDFSFDNSKFDISGWHYVIVWLLKNSICYSVGYFKDNVFKQINRLGNKKKVKVGFLTTYERTFEGENKKKVNIVRLCSLLIEIVWIPILIACLMVEKKITTKINIPDKYTLYFDTVFLVMAGEYFTYNVFTPLVKKMFAMCWVALYPGCCKKMYSRCWKKSYSRVSVVSPTTIETEKK